MGVLRRLRDLFRRAGEPGLDPDDPGLRVVAEAFDDAEADSAVLARSVATGLRVDRPAVLRHHLVLPGRAVEEAGRLLALDDWSVRPAPAGGPPDEGAPEPAGDGLVRLAAVRVQHLDALHCAQARSRMAGLAQRLGGTALGWDALQPPAGDDGAARR